MDAWDLMTTWVAWPFWTVIGVGTVYTIWESISKKGA